MTWSAAQYLAFEDERTRPVRGIDSSADMIMAARKRLPLLRFEVTGIEAWIKIGAGRGSEPDVILANAVLQWVPDHAALFPSLLAKLAPAGSLAVQMPDNLNEPAHRLMRELAVDGPWRHKLAGAAHAREPIAGADWYYQLLRAHCAKVDTWRTTYYHPLTGGEHAVVEWFKGSGLRPFLEPLDPTERDVFLTRYAAAVRAPILLGRTAPCCCHCLDCSSSQSARLWRRAVSAPVVFAPVAPRTRPCSRRSRRARI